MTWTKLDDAFPDHPKISPLSDGAFRLHVEGLSYANRLLTDGRIPKTAVFIIPRKRFLHELVPIVWEDAGDHYEIHDFLDYNPSKAEVEQRRLEQHEAKVRAGRAGGLAKASRRLAAASDVLVAEDLAKRSPVPTRPVQPHLPEPAFSPLTPRDAGGSKRAQRAANGSKRKRDVAALEEEAPEVKYFGGKYGRILRQRIEAEEAAS